MEIKPYITPALGITAILLGGVALGGSAVSIASHFQALTIPTVSNSLNAIVTPWNYVVNFIPLPVSGIAGIGGGLYLLFKSKDALVATREKKQTNSSNGEVTFLKKEELTEEQKETIKIVLTSRLKRASANGKRVHDFRVDNEVWAYYVRNGDDFIVCCTKGYSQSLLLKNEQAIMEHRTLTLSKET